MSKSYWPLQRNDDGTYERILKESGYRGETAVRLIRYRPDLDGAVHASNGVVCDVECKYTGIVITALEVGND